MGSGILAVGSLATLVIVAAIDDVDLLSTVALALAVLAFAIQIIVFAIQGWTANRINAETIALLEQVRTSSHDTRELLASQFENLLNHVIGTAVEESEDQGFDPAELERRLEEFRRALGEPPPQVGDFPRPAVTTQPRPEPSPEDRAIHELLTTYPDGEEGRESLAVLRTLSPFGLSALRRFSEAERNARRIGREPGLLYRDDASPGPDELERRGFLEEFESATRPAPPAGARRLRLTAAGRNIGRLLTAPGPAPDWLQQDLAEQ